MTNLAVAFAKWYQILIKMLMIVWNCIHPNPNKRNNLVSTMNPINDISNNEILISRQLNTL